MDSHLYYRAKEFVTTRSYLIRPLLRAYDAAFGWRGRREMQRRAELPVYDLEALCADFPFLPGDILNYRYGLSYILKRYAGLSPRAGLCAFIEHGLYLGSYVQPCTYYLPESHVITFSDVRAGWLRKDGLKKEIVRTGPMIHYAPDLYPDQEDRLRRLKDQLGRTLLFFPSHSDEALLVETGGVTEYIARLKHLAEGFNTVLVSVYWADHGRGEMEAAYLEAGFIPVTSGHKFDPLFLARQRFIISLADVTVSEEVGTHVGYCVHLGKPHTVMPYHRERHYANATQEEIHKSIRSQQDEATYREEVATIEAEFMRREPFTTISAGQRAVVAKYWGTDYILTPEEMHRLIRSTRPMRGQPVPQE